MSTPGAIDRDALAALPELRRALSFEGSLRSRTEGLTWMLWGLVTAAIFVSYDWAGQAFDEMPWWAEWLWAWWVAAGSAFTWALWRTAALTAGVDARRPAGFAVTMLFVGAGALGWALALLVVRTPQGDQVVPLLAVGTAWLAAGVLGFARATPLGRRVLMAVGAAILLLGALLLALYPGDASWHSPASETARDALRAGRLLVAGLVPFLAGLWQATRG